MQQLVFSSWLLFPCSRQAIPDHTRRGSPVFHKHPQGAITALGGELLSRGLSGATEGMRRTALIIESDLCSQHTGGIDANSKEIARSTPGVNALKNTNAKNKK